MSTKWKQQNGCKRKEVVKIKKNSEENSIEYDYGCSTRKH